MYIYILIYYIDISVLLENTPVLKFIQNYNPDGSSVFSISPRVRKFLDVTTIYPIMYQNHASLHLNHNIVCVANISFVLISTLSLFKKQAFWISYFVKKAFFLAEW